MGNNHTSGTYNGCDDQLFPEEMAADEIEVLNSPAIKPAPRRPRNRGGARRMSAGERRGRGLPRLDTRP